jgi:very-short-patch-repair endonuclease
VVEEYRFAPPRRWKFDLALPDQKIAVEQEGGLWIGGRHNRAQGFIRDMEKYNEAVQLGWRLLRFTPAEVRTGIACAAVHRLLNTILEKNAPA